MAAYGRALTGVLRHQGITLVVAGLTLALTVLLWIAVPKGFFPAQDISSSNADKIDQLLSKYNPSAARATGRW